jgi:peptidoglycan L-alanyl-D-glutamate endopeptidase CwlK
MYKLSKRSYERLNGVDAILIAILTEAIKESPFDFGIPRSGGLRTAEEQYILYKDGKSQLDGFKKKSYHQTGKAFDIYAYVDGKASWDKGQLTEIARHIQKVAKDKFNVDLEWGGDWKRFVDMPHFQID